MDEIGIDLQTQVSYVSCGSSMGEELMNGTIQDLLLLAQISEKQAPFNLPLRDEELYSTWKRLEAHKEFLELQEVRSISSHMHTWLIWCFRNISGMKRRI